MDYTLSEYQLSRLMQDAAEMGANIALSSVGFIKPSICKQEACRIYGRTRIDKWIKAGKIKKSKDGSWNIDRVHLLALNKEQSPIYKSIKVQYSPL